MDFFSKYDLMRFGHIAMRIWSHLLKKPLMENFIFCAVLHSSNSLIVTDSVV